MARRKSVFQEVGLPETQGVSPERRERPQSVRFRSRDEIHLVERYEDEDIADDHRRIDYDISLNGLDTTQSPPPFFRQTMMYRLGAALLLLTAVIPLLHSTAIFGHNPAIPIQGVNGGAIPENARAQMAANVERRADSPTHVCFRWAQMSALVNGTLYLYGGQASTEPGQTENTWDNYFLSLDLTKTWQTGSAPLVGLPQPNGPPAVALGYLWNSHDSLYLYGGEFSWKPPVDPVPFSTWEYHIPSKKWIEHSNPVTSKGQSAPSNNVPVQRAAEGAGVNIPQLGRGFYFGGHLDGYTTPGWSQSIPRVYLQSLLEYTFPGYSNNDIDALKSGNKAGDAGVYRNITVGGLQADYGFTARADGLLIYIPGFGAQGILVALAGGTNETFTQMNAVNVFDIASSKWYTQTTSGSRPKIRVNPCAVVAAAPDGSSYNIYMFGGQNLIPYGSQTQYHDMWILSIPSFTWIKVPQKTAHESIPYGRSGATCNIWDGQMVMIGGYIGADLTCESPDIYIFNLSSLEWEVQFTALPKGIDDSPRYNPLNQQPNQRAHGSDPGGLEGSYGYEVPELVYATIGGNKYGGATITTPAISPTAGPMATGSAITYTVTKPNGHTVTQTASPGTVAASGSSGPNIAAIVVGVVCGLLLIVICYLLFCLYLYRKQLKLYKRHVEMSQRQARGEKPPVIPGLWTSDSGKTSTERRADGNQLLTPADGTSKAGSSPSHGGSGAQTGSAAANSGQSARRSSEQSSTEDLLMGHEPTFVGVMLNPRRSLRVINRD